MQYKKEVEQGKVNETILQKQLNQSKEITNSLQKEVEQKQIEYQKELNEEKAMKERQEIVNKKLRTELEELKKSEEKQKVLVENKMHQVEEEFVQKQKIAVQSEHKKQIEEQEKNLQKQKEKYELQLIDMKNKIQELEAFRKKAQEEKDKETAKVQERMDADEDKQYKKTLEDTKDTIKKEKDEVKKEEDDKKMMEYVNSFNQQEKQKSRDQDLDDNLKSITTMANMAKTDDMESAQNANDKMAVDANEDSQTQLEENQAAILVLKALTDSKKELSQTANVSSSQSVSQKESAAPAAPTVQLVEDKKAKN